MSECGIGGTNTLTREFNYDPLYRIINANGRENSPTVTPIWDDRYRSTDNTTTTLYTQYYSYDRLGNIQKLQHIGNNNFTRNFNYTNSNNQLQSIDIGMTNYAFTYDACGNQIQETASRHCEWDAFNQMRCFYVDDGSGNITKYTQYLYDASGNRVKKITWKPASDYDSISYIDGIYEYRTDGTDEQNLLHIMDDTSRIAMVRLGDNFGDTTPAIKYNLEDQIGSSSMRSNASGTVIDKEEYYPFGDSSLRTFSKKRYRYVGKEKDLESGLHYYGARYYAAWTCRFISVDPLAADYPFYTPYNYAGNKPVNKIDIDGMQEEGAETAPTNGNPSAGSEINVNKISREEKQQNRAERKERAKEIKKSYNEGKESLKNAKKGFGKIKEGLIDIHNKNRFLEAQQYADDNDGIVNEHLAKGGRKFYSVNTAEIDKEGVAITSKFFNFKKYQKHKLNFIYPVNSEKYGVSVDILVRTLQESTLH